MNEWNRLGLEFILYPLLGGLLGITIWVSLIIIDHRRARRAPTSPKLICRTCGYDILATSQPRCPECGSAF